MRASGSPHISASVGLVGIQSDLLQEIHTAIGTEAVLPAESSSFAEGVNHALRSLPDVILVDVDGQVEAAVKFAQALREANTDLTLIALARKSSADTILTLMRAGFKEFAVLPDDAERLRGAVGQAAQNRLGEAGTAMVISVVGSKGGVGTTLIATNLAAELAAIHRVLCLDLDMSMGDVAPMMDMTAKDSVLDLLNRAASVDERVLSGVALVHPSKVHLLCQPDQIDQPFPANPDGIFDVINAAAQGFQYVIIDGGVAVNDLTSIAAKVSDHILLITTPDVISVRDAHRKAQALISKGVDKRHIHLVINKMPRQPYLSAEQIETNLGLRIVGIIPEDARRVDQAVNEGKVIRDLFPTADVVVGISRLVGLLSEDPEEMSVSRAQEQKGSLLSRLFGGSAKKK